MKIAVGLSGGVDSSVAAALLKHQGHEVLGITMKLWRPGRYRGGTKDACFGPGEADDIARAENLCRRLGIAHHVIDCSEEYEKEVLDYFRSEYLAGRTPNPCVRCNALMKFGLLPRLARRSGAAFDRFATGHYARLRKENGIFHLLRGADEKKDQSYFLYRLKQTQLKDLLFPLGDFCKSEVRELAAQYGLEVKDKPDSQDFYSGDHTELLRAASGQHRRPLRPGSRHPSGLLALHRRSAQRTGRRGGKTAVRPRGQRLPQRGGGRRPCRNRPARTDARRLFVPRGGAGGGSMGEGAVGFAASSGVLPRGEAVFSGRCFRRRAGAVRRAVPGRRAARRRDH